MFSKFELTNKGRDLLNRVIAEKKTLKFTKFHLGKGDFSGDKKTLTQLVSKFDEFNITQTSVLPGGLTNIKGFYDNRNLNTPSKLTEIGIMAQLGDDSLTEVLFSYSNQPSADAETVPSKDSYFSRTFSVMNKTDNVTSVTFDLTIKQDKYNFGTLAEMKSADYLDVGDKVVLWGNNALGDSSVKMYIITDQTQTIQLNNKLYAKEHFAIVDNLTSDSVHTALSGKMGKKLDTDKQNKADNNLQTSAKQVVPAINELKGRIDNFKTCPYNVGDIFLTTNATNPSTVWLGTTWQKIEGRFLLGTSGSGASKQTGGSNSKTITQANLPNVKLTVNSFSLSRGTMEITGAVKTTTDFGVVRGPGSCTGAFAKTGWYGNRPEGAGGTGSTDFDFKASRAWTGSTNSVSPQTNNLGSGQALDITPAYYTCHMWLRTS